LARDFYAIFVKLPVFNFKVKFIIL